MGRVETTENCLRSGLLLKTTGHDLSGQNDLARSVACGIGSEESVQHAFSTKDAFSSTIFNSLACRLTVNSPISSRNSVPPPAASNLPSFAEVVPVKAPFSSPNSSASMIEGVSSAQPFGCARPLPDRTGEGNESRDALRLSNWPGIQRAV